MSIPLREGFVDETLERCLEDLLVRFVLNCPEEDLSSIERVLFQIEEAHWFYQDFLRTVNPLLPSMKMKLFTNKLIEQCPLVWKWGDPSEALSQFGKYKSTIPVRGCALLNPSLTKILLVKGIESPSWGFPRGKISKDESDVDCALRELDEETGFDASDLIQEDVFVERTIKGKNYKIFIIKGVPEDFHFAPKVRYEISEIRWMDIKYLTKAIKSTNNFYLVGSMIKPIIAYINRVKRGESEDELKILATAQLKKILGIEDHIHSENECADPGRELLALLKSVGTSGVADSTTLSQSLDCSSQQQLQKTWNATASNLATVQQKFPKHLPDLPSQLFAYQHNRMIPINNHTPFPLQMFNPYHSFSPYAFGQINNTAINGSLYSQEMSMAPSGSTLPKPQFIQRPNPQNARELLNVLRKPITRDARKDGSAELLSIIKKEDFKSLSSNSSPPSNSISLSKKQPISEKDANEDVRTKERKKPKALIDITEPANDSTSRDIISSISNDKPIVLLRKGATNNLVNPDSFASPIVDSSSKANIAHQEEAVTNTSQKNEVHLLNEFLKPEKGDPSAQFLNILQRKDLSSPTATLSLDGTTSNLETSDAVNNGLDEPYISASMTNDALSNTSKLLLDLVKNKVEHPHRVINDSSAVLIDASKPNQKACSTNSAEKASNKRSNDASTVLLQNLKSRLPKQQESNDPSAKLLDLLKAQRISNDIHSVDEVKEAQRQGTFANDSSKTLPQVPSKHEPSDLSTELLDVLKNSHVIQNQQAVLPKTENNESKILPSNFTNVLKGLDIPPPSAIESFQNFDDWDAEGSDGYEDAAEYVNDVLYE